jgi:hypothetical protein
MESVIEPIHNLDSFETCQVIGGNCCEEFQAALEFLEGDIHVLM